MYTVLYKTGCATQRCNFSLSYRSDIIIYTRATLLLFIQLTLSRRRAVLIVSIADVVFNIFTTNIIIAPISFRANTAIAAVLASPTPIDKLIITIIRLRYFHFFSPFIFTTCLFLPTKPIATIYITIRVYGYLLNIYCTVRIVDCGPQCSESYENDDHRNIKHKHP